MRLSHPTPEKAPTRLHWGRTCREGLAWAVQQAAASQWPHLARHPPGWQGLLVAWVARHLA